MAEERISLVNSRGLMLQGVLHLPEKEPKKEWVMLSHGMLSTKDSQKHIALSAALAKEGYHVFRFDFSGQGESEGDASIITLGNGIDDLQCAIKLMELKGAKKFILAGSSMGSGVSILTAGLFGDKVVALTLMASITKSTVIWDALGENEQKMWKENGYFVFEERQVAYEAVIDAMTHDVAAALTAFHGPVLFVHGEKDELIAFEDVEAFSKLHPGRTDLHKLVGADHRMSEDKHRQEAVETIKNWLASTL